MSSRLLGLGMACLLAGACAQTPPPNLIVISLDTTRADHLGAYGWERARTPNIDGLAAEGFVFDRYMTPVPITLPAHTTMFTGHFPPTHTVRDNGTFTVPDWELTLAEVLTEEGYDTSAFVASFPLAARFGLNQGFAHYDDRFLDAVTDVDGFRFKPRSGVFFDERPATAVVDAAVAYLQGRLNRPFFTFLHFFDPHQPLNPPPPYDVDFSTDLYDGEIAYADEQIGRFLRFLRDQEAWDNTIIVVTADHGEGLGDHGEISHAMLLHQATLHVPLIIRGPGVSVGKSDRWAMSTSLMATVLDLLGVDAGPAPRAPRGPSLRPIIDGTATDSWDRDFRAYFETVAPRFGQGWSQLAGWMEGDWRLVAGPEPRLYNLAEDPAEVENVIQNEPDRVRECERGLRSFLEANETESVGESMRAIDRETADRLAALGYLREDLGNLDSFHDMLDFGAYPDPYAHVAEVSVLSLAKAALSAGRWELGESLCDEMLRTNPLNATAHRMKGVAAGVAEDWTTSLEHLERAEAIEPDNMDTRFLVGTVQIQAGRRAEGVATLESLPDAERSIDACTWIGRALADEGDLEGAELWYRRGLEVEPNQRWLLLYLGNLLARQGRFDEAEPVYRHLTAEDPYSVLGFYNYARMAYENGRLDEARRLAGRALKVSPGHQPTVDLMREIGRAP